MSQRIGATYDPARVIATWNGVPLSGYAPGTMISVSRNADAATSVSGADGESAFVRSQDKTGGGTFSLMNTSLGNSVLTAAFVAWEAVGATGVITITDLSTGSTLFSAQAVPKKPAPLEYGTDMPVKAWEIEMLNVQILSFGSV